MIYTLRNDQSNCRKTLKYGINQVMTKREFSTESALLSLVFMADIGVPVMTYFVKLSCVAYAQDYLGPRGMGLWGLDWTAVSCQHVTLASSLYKLLICILHHCSTGTIFVYMSAWESSLIVLCYLLSRLVIKEENRQESLGIEPRLLAWLVHWQLKPTTSIGSTPSDSCLFPSLFII